MIKKPSIIWRWKGSLKSFTEGIVRQETKNLIKIDNEWFLKDDLEIRGYEERVK